MVRQHRGQDDGAALGWLRGPVVKPLNLKIEAGREGHKAISAFELTSTAGATVI